MDKEEFRIKLEEINLLVERKDYKGAMNVVDSIDWRRVKNVRTLCVVGEIYAANKRYEESKEIFLLAYHRSSIGKNILYRLIEVSLKMGDIEEAMEYYEEYMEVAPNDNTRYILKYKIYKAKKASIDELIQILEEYKEKEFTERWSYELASLYYQAGQKEKCLELCNQMVIWFSEGKYVMKALELKLRLGSLEGEEKEKYEQQFVPNLIKPEEAKSLKENKIPQDQEDKDAAKKEIPVLEDESPAIESIRMDEKDINNAESLQEKISKGIRDIFGGKKKESEEDSDQKSSEETPEEVHEEMIKDISSKLDYVDVPDLEPEEESQAEEKTEKKEEKPDLSQTIQIPSLKIPKSMKNINTQENEVAEDVSKEKSDIQETEGESVDDLSMKKDFDFNLEDTILAAASAQGIEIPDESSNTSVKEERKEPEAEEIEEEVVEEEFEEESEEEPEEEELEEESEEEPEEEEFEEESEDKIEIPPLEEEDFLSEEDLREAEAEFLNGPSANQEQKSMQNERPHGMNTEMFNFQEEIKKILGNEDRDNFEVENQDSYDAKIFDSDVFSKAAADTDDSKEETSIDEDAELRSAIERFERKEAAEASGKAEPLTEEEELEQFIDSIQPKNQRSPYDIVPRELELTDDEKKLFTYFVRVPGMKDQLVDTLYDVQMAAADKTSRTGNIIVMGGRETGKTRLISSLIPAICKELNLEASKVAYVFAEQINGRDMSRIVSKLAGGFLVIENANQLTPETADQLDKAMEFRTDGLTVIIEDEKIGMRKFIARYPKLAKKFTSMINIPVFTNDELVSFANVYTRENGYTIDKMAMLVLYELIGMNQKEDKPMNIGAVKNLLDAAIAKSQGGIRKLQRNISKKRTDHDGFVVLYEKDFK